MISPDRGDNLGRAAKSAKLRRKLINLPGRDVPSDVLTDEQRIAEALAHSRRASSLAFCRQVSAGVLVGPSALRDAFHDDEATIMSIVLQTKELFDGRYDSVLKSVGDDQLLGVDPRAWPNLVMAELARRAHRLSRGGGGSDRRVFKERPAGGTFLPGSVRGAAHPLGGLAADRDTCSCMSLALQLDAGLAGAHLREGIVSCVRRVALARAVLWARSAGGSILVASDDASARCLILSRGLLGAQALGLRPAYRFERAVRTGGLLLALGDLRCGLCGGLVPVPYVPLEHPLGGLGV